MNLDWFRTFAEVVERRSYSRAAEALFITQPAASQHIKNLERVFGADLRVRNEREFRTTDAGDMVYELSRRIMQDIAQVRESITRSRATCRRIVIGSPPTALNHYLPVILREFSRLNPDVEVKTVMTLDASSITSALLANEIDLAIQIERYIPKILCKTPCFNDEFIVVARPSHRLGQAASATAAELGKERIAVAPRPSESRRMIDEWFAEHGVTRLSSIECESFDQSRAVALAGHGVAFVTRLVVLDDLRAKRLHEVSVDGLALGRTVYAAWLPDPIPEVTSIVRVIERMFGDDSVFV